MDDGFVDAHVADKGHASKALGISDRRIIDENNLIFHQKISTAADNHLNYTETNNQIDHSLNMLLFLNQSTSHHFISSP